MPKRKREHNEDSQSTKHSAQNRRVEEKLFHGKKVLQRALKLAKGFERQKLGRRQKTAKQKGESDELGRLDAEIAALKDLDLTLTAEAHLYKAIQKEKALSSAPALLEFATEPPKPTQEPAVANVTARLYNSNPVKEAMKEALSHLRSILGVDGPTQKKQKRVAGDMLTDKPIRATAKPTMISGEETLNPTEEVTEEGMSGSEEEEEEEEEVDDLVGEDSGSVEWDTLSMDEDALDAFDKRLAGSSDEESNDEDIKTRQTALRRNFASNLSISPDASLPPSLSPEPQSTSNRKASTSLGYVRAKTDFLPSLTMGGYWSGSESEPEDGVADVAPRKNRRGQRARQQIWEKKYGKGAKHIQNAKTKPKASRDDGWDMKRGAQESGRGRNGTSLQNGSYGRNTGAQGEIASGGNATEVVPRMRKPDRAAIDNKPLHPSWEAAKKAKESKQTVAFAGKKMTFD